MASEFDVEVDFDLTALRDMLVKDPAFIRAVAVEIRNEMIKGARRTGDSMGKWAQRPVPVAAQTQTPGTNRIS